MEAMIKAQYTLMGCAKREGDWFIAYCPPLDITTQGKTLAEAKQNLEEAASLLSSAASNVAPWTKPCAN
jgi:predicted RNase H-like HicB family nuclease